MWNFMYEFMDEYSDLCGERIFVQCDTEDEAIEILSENFWGERVKCLGKYTDEEAEEYGYDTY